MNKLLDRKSWVEIALLVIIGLVGIGFILFIILGVSTTKPNLPSNGPSQSISVPPAPSSTHVAQSPSKGSSVSRGTKDTHLPPRGAQGGSGGHRAGSTTGGGPTVSGPTPVATPTPHPTPAPTAHRPVIGVTVPPINVPPIIGISLPSISIG